MGGVGWKCCEDEVGDHLFLVDFGGEHVQIIPSVGGHFRVLFNPSVSTGLFRISFRKYLIVLII